MNPKELILYQTETGKEPFSEWLNDLDRITRNRVRVRLDRVEQGNYGDHKSVGDGVVELRLFFGPGYRIYLAEDGNTLVVLLCGGDKDTQTRDIAKAKAYWQAYLEAKSANSEDTDQGDPS